MKIIPFKAQHLKGLKLQESQLKMQGAMEKEDYGNDLEYAGPGFTVMVDERVVAVCGLFMMWENRGIAWALYTQDAINNFRPIYKATKKYFEMVDISRIEAYVEIENTKGHNLARSLGFKVEAERLSKYYPNGNDATLYARVK